MIVPRKEEFYTTMRQWGAYLHGWYRAYNSPPTDQGLANAYYDGEEAAWRLGNSELVNDSFNAYVNYYVLPNQGRVQGYRNFTEGQVKDVLVSSSRAEKALESIKLQLLNGSYVATGDCQNSSLSRECAYALMTHVSADRVDIPLSLGQDSRRLLLSAWARGHIIAWVNGTSAYYRPFMGAITVKALSYYWDSYGGPDSLGVKSLCDRTWLLWKEVDGPWGRGQSFLYTDKDVGDPDDKRTTPDLNLLIAPMFALAYKLSGDTSYAEKALKIFNGGIPVYENGLHKAGAYLGTKDNPLGKHINQQMFWIDKFFTWMEGTSELSEKSYLIKLRDDIQARIDSL